MRLHLREALGMTVLAAAVLCGACAAPGAERTLLPSAPEASVGPVLYSSTRLNLARTSLARVSASCVNGRRDISDPFYGALNAFDEGKNVKNDIQYSYWLGCSEQEPWFEIFFDSPVRVSSIDVECPEGTQVSALLRTASGDQIELPWFSAPSLVTEAAERSPSISEWNGKPLLTRMPRQYSSRELARLKLAEPVVGVTSLLLSFARAQGDADNLVAALGPNFQIHEIRVFGSPPEDVSYEIGLPRIVVDSRTAALAAKSAFTIWHQKHFTAAEPSTVEEPDRFVTTYSVREHPYCRVLVDKATGEAVLESLIDFPGPESD